MLRVPPLSKKCCCCGIALDAQAQVVSALIVRADNFERCDYCSNCSRSSLKEQRDVQATWTINRNIATAVVKRLPGYILEMLTQADESAQGVKWLLAMFLHRLGYLSLVQENATVMPITRLYEVIDTGELIQVIFSNPSAEARILLEQIAQDIPQEAKAS